MARDERRTVGVLWGDINRGRAMVSMVGDVGMTRFLVGVSNSPFSGATPKTGLEALICRLDGVSTTKVDCTESNLCLFIWFCIVSSSSKSELGSGQLLRLLSPVGGTRLVGDLEGEDGAGDVPIFGPGLVGEAGCFEGEGFMGGTRLGVLVGDLRTVVGVRGKGGRTEAEL